MRCQGRAPVIHVYIDIDRRTSVVFNIWFYKISHLSTKISLVYHCVKILILTDRPKVISIYTSIPSDAGILVPTKDPLTYIFSCDITFSLEIIPLSYF